MWRVNLPRVQLEKSNIKSFFLIGEVNAVAGIRDL